MCRCTRLHKLHQNNYRLQERRNKKNERKKERKKKKKKKKKKERRKEGEQKHTAVKKEHNYCNRDATRECAHFKQKYLLAQSNELLFLSKNEVFFVFCF